MSGTEIKMPGRSQGAEPILLDVPRFEQPDDVTCGPTCLAQVYRYHGHPKALPQIIQETPRNPDGGTLAVYLGVHSIRNGFQPTIYSYNLRIFDPTWRDLPVEGLIDRLEQRLQFVESKRLGASIRAYIEYLREGGEVRFEELSRELMVRLLATGQPILTGLSATYLYGTPREYRDQYDDIRGDPVGHFVVICGYYPEADHFIVRDPSSHIPFSQTGKYSVDSERLISAILLGDITYDAVLLVLSRPEDPA